MNERGGHLVVEADGGSRGNPGPAGYGALVIDGDTGELLAERADYLGVASNNVAEYTGLIAGLTAAHEIDSAATVHVRMDSRLVVEQMSGRWQIKHADMRRLAARARAIFPAVQVSYTWVPRAQNTRADRLANRAMDERVAVRWDRASGPEDSMGQPEPRVVGTRPHGRPSGASPRMTTPATTIIAVRHGVTELTLGRRFSGSVRPGPALAPEGVEQARGAAELVARGHEWWPDIEPASVVYASPLARTMGTAAVIAARLGVDVWDLPALAEVDFGEWEGLEFAEVEQRWPGEYTAWTDSASVRPPGGESIADLSGRVRSALDIMIREHVGATVVVVTHVNVVRTFVGLASLAPIDQWNRIRTVPAGTHVLRFTAGGAAELVAVDLPPALGWRCAAALPAQAARQSESGRAPVG